MQNNINSKIIIACDFASRGDFDNFLNKMGDKKMFLKFGMQFIYKEGLGIITEMQKLGHNIFIDLKLHDIPNTVEQALISLRHHNAELINIHALGGRKMMEKAAKVFEGTKTKLIAVTILTSASDEELDEIGIKSSVKDTVENLMRITSESNIPGVVCSAQETPIAKKYNLLTITPGIRPANSAKNDQVRVVTPKQAIENGSDYIVIGRPITKSDNPLEAYEEIQKEIGEI